MNEGLRKGSAPLTSPFVNITKALFLPLIIGSLFASVSLAGSAESAQPFGPDFPKLDSAAVGEWWKLKPKQPALDLKSPRDEVVAFALYTHQNGVLKLTAQMYPLMPGESREVRLEFKRDGQWTEAAKAPVLYPGWSSHFRIENWDASRDVPYRVRHGENAFFEGLIRRDPIEKDVLVVASLSCNSSRTPGPRAEIVRNIKLQDPDLLFFAGDQTYRHTEHTAGWLEFGVQFREILRDRPTITIPDDHDIGQGNIWGEGGKKAATSAGNDGGYHYPAAYVKMVERCQTWHLPDPVDPRPIKRGIGVYFTRLVVGGVDFAILEDRKFKSGPKDKIPQMGPRPDHINDESYDPKTVDLPGLEMLGDRQVSFLHEWGQDWTGAEMKCVLSQTAFCGAVHLHGKDRDRLLADLDSNGWPQSGRNAALTEIRRAWAPHLCGDQHLAVMVQHGIDAWGDGPFGFTNPAIVNTIYGRWWWPKDEKPGLNPVADSPLPWTGDYKDGFGNRITMLAYANPPDVTDEKQRGDGYGLVRFHKPTRQITFEAWPRFADVRDGDQAQFPGWPLTILAEENDGREPVAWLPELVFAGAMDPVVQVVEESTGNILYTVRTQGNRFQPRVYAKGKYTVKIGRDKPDTEMLTGITAKPKANAGQKKVQL